MHIILLTVFIATTALAAPRGRDQDLFVPFQERSHWKPPRVIEGYDVPENDRDVKYMSEGEDEFPTEPEYPSVRGFKRPTTRPRGKSGYSLPGKLGYGRPQSGPPSRSPPEFLSEMLGPQSNSDNEYLSDFINQENFRPSSSRLPKPEKSSFSKFSSPDMSFDRQQPIYYEGSQKAGEDLDRNQPPCDDMECCDCA